ncbi:biotin transporter BioY [Phreatobacter cathodiphilus]|uniref:Biotin transporter n=1 Tax=Phreatobacter cathodiphilus TaxID=1868589 RepID=A0A2S0N7R9_9HYPH|nr:biotin transporter BioY [Phreatobacter cathodiphilus]AVO43981.1 biotin transporter BioY [Phreatobacter cathodiphilus]
MSDATIAATLWPSGSAALPATTLRSLALVAGGVCLITLGAKASVPFWPVPLTLQTLAISVVAAAYGLRLGVATVATYLLAGLLGAPVFAGWSVGIAPFMGPTGGFLAGFLVMSAIIGAAADRGWDKAWPTTLAAMALANVIVFVPGLLWLGTFTGYGDKLLAAGLWPFALGTLVKTALAAALMPLAWGIVARLRG